MPQRSRNRLNETYFFYPLYFRWYFRISSDPKSVRKSTCGQLRDYINIPLDGYFTQSKTWVRNCYRRVHYDVVILNGPCRAEVGRRISFGDVDDFLDRNC